MGSTTNKGTPRGRARALQPDTAAKQLRCMDHAIRGLTYQEIAELEGYADPSGARQAVARAFKRSFDASAEELRPRYQARAELLWSKGLTLLERGMDTRETEEGEPIPPDLDMAKAGAQIMDRALGRLMRLSGLDQPTTVLVPGGPDLNALKAEFIQYLPALVGGQVPLDVEVVEDGDDRG